MLTRSFYRMCSVILFTFCSQAIFASDQLTTVESDTIVKEDIAAAQVLIEVCPAFIGHNPKLNQNINTVSQTFLQDLSVSNMTLAQLYKDTEYQNIFSATKKEALEVDKVEQKSACEDALNIEH